MTKFCPQCQGELLPEWGTFSRCPTCRERNNAEARSATGKARAARFRENNRPRLRVENAARMADSYNANAEAKLCVDGCGNPATKFKRCAACRRKRTEWNRNYRERLRAAEARTA